MIIGSFAFDKSRYSGRLSTLGLDVPISIVPAELDSSETAPDWKVLNARADNGTEIGAGWNRTGKRAGNYIAVQIDDPGFAQPLRAILVQAGDSDEVWHLLWSRSKTRDPR